MKDIQKRNNSRMSERTLVEPVYVRITALIITARNVGVLVPIEEFLPFFHAEAQSTQSRQGKTIGDCYPKKAPPQRTGLAWRK